MTFVINITHVFLYRSIGSHRSFADSRSVPWLEGHRMLQYSGDPRFFFVCDVGFTHLLHSFCTRAILPFWTGQLLSACVTFEFVDSYVKWRCRLLISFCICTKLCNNKCCSLILVSQFLHAFAKLRKVTITSIMSVTSVCPHGTTWLKLDGFSWNFIYEYSEWKSANKIQVLWKSD